MAQVLLRSISIFFVADFAVILAHVFFSEQSWLFDLDQEGNIPTYLAALQVLLVAVVMFEIFIRERRVLSTESRGKWVWLFLATVFLYLSVDDVYAIHESFLRQEVRDLLPADSLWISLIPWQIVFAPLLGLTAILLTVMMLSRFHQERRLMKITTAALACWVAAIVLEGLAKPVFLTLNAYSVGVVFEESLELLGATLFLAGFANYAALLKAQPLPSSVSQPYQGVLPRAAGIIAGVTCLGALIIVLISVSNKGWLYRHNGGILAQSGQYDRAIIAFQQSLDVEPNNQETLHALATAYLKTDRDAEALKTCDKLLSVEQNRAPLWQLRAVTLEKMGRYKEAEQSLLRASKINPRHAVIWAQLGGCQQQQKNLSAALKSYEMALRLNPAQPDLIQTAQQLKEKLADQESSTSDSATRSAVAQIDNPFEDGWDTEAFATLAGKQLKSFGKLLKDESLLTAESLAPFITTDFSCQSLLPKNKEDVFSGDALAVQRGDSSDTKKTFSGISGFLEAATELLSPFRPADHIRSKFKIFGVKKGADGKHFDTKLYVNLTGHDGKEMVE
ncbi:MAG: tetratricopeptide repeat protein, partial [Planctomycetota bacterium]|nr:tetratricopeptide repeat protein [Planctomycetota bacterium]